ncbi:hypothetical protein ACNQPY_10345 [Mycobacteroides abscessus]|uniref:hypothetical protein n=1 Tax=Mycobacteroides abscessus TaxID=36809 RepID=UPI003AAA4D57
MSALSHPADERRVREIVRDELAGLKGGDAGLKTSGIRLKLDELLNEPSRLARQLDVPHEGESDHAFTRRVIESALDRFVGREVVGDHVSERDAALPSLGYVQLSPNIPHNKTPYVARALTRYVTGAFLTAFRWLQRKAVTRRAAESGTRPSGTTQGGAR